MLTMAENNDVALLQRAMEGLETTAVIARSLQRSERQVYRMMARIREQGPLGIVHRSRGRPSKRRLKENTVRKIMKLVEQKYQDINDTHLREILAREEDIHIGRETLRRYLRQAGRPAKLKRRFQKHRSRRERKPSFGIMLQVDASHHDWLEGRGPQLSLIGGKDDATNHVWARFEDQETTWGYLNLMEDVCCHQGVPVSLYSDRHMIFFSPREATIEEQIKNISPLTQFGRAMKELGVTLIPAYSPQAKGRIENQWKTFQDRLVVELRLKGCKTKEEANAMLPEFLKSYNRQFAVPAMNHESAFRRSPTPGVLSRILCLKETRMVAKDHTVSFEGLVLQIPPSRRWRSIAGQHVEVLQLKNGSTEIEYKGMTVASFTAEAVTRMVVQNKHQKTQLKIHRDILKKAA